MPTQMNPTAQNNNGTPRIAPPPKHLTTLTMKSFAPSLKDNLPLHAQYLLNLDTKHGGIGLTSPRLHAIPAFILSTKTTIDTIQRGRGIFSSPLFSIFYKYAPELASLCTSNNTTEIQIFTFISHSPLHQCHDAINTNIKYRLQTDFLQRLDKDVKIQETCGTQDVARTVTR